MMARGGAALYTPEILGLAVELAAFPLTDDLPLRGEAVSRVCGSRVAVGIATRDGAIDRIGARVTACAVGQAAAAIFLRASTGRDVNDLNEALSSMTAWLGGADRLPHWPGVEVLDPARAYSARHPAILLPWRAAVSALSNPARPD